MSSSALVRTALLWRCGVGHAGGRGRPTQQQGAPSRSYVRVLETEGGDLTEKLREEMWTDGGYVCGEQSFLMNWMRDERGRGIKEDLQVSNQVDGGAFA